MKTLAAVVVGLVCSACAIAPTAAERDVVGAVQALFDGMRARDPEAVRAMLCDDAQFLSVAVVDGRAVPRPSTAAAFLASLGSGDEPLITVITNVDSSCHPLMYSRKKGPVISLPFSS